jgi:hypothetical protein
MTMVPWARVTTAAENSLGEWRCRISRHKRSADIGRASKRYFAAEIIGNMLSVEPRRWRRPQKLDYALNKTRASKLGNMFQPYNWTLELQQS